MGRVPGREIAATTTTTTTIYYGFLTVRLASVLRASPRLVWVELEVARCHTIMAATETVRQIEVILLMVLLAGTLESVPEAPEMDRWCSGLRDGEVSMVSARSSKLQAGKKRKEVES